MSSNGGRKLSAKEIKYLMGMVFNGDIDTKYSRRVNSSPNISNNPAVKQSGRMTFKNSNNGCQAILDYNRTALKISLNVSLPYDSDDNNLGNLTNDLYDVLAKHGYS